MTNATENDIADPSLVKRLSFLAKMTIFSTTMSAVLLFNILISPLVFTFGKRDKMNLITGRMLAGAAQSTLGLDIDVVNEQQVLEQLNGKPAIFIANHQTSLDAVMLGKVFPPNTAVMAKSTLRFAPLLGQFLIIGDNVFITRTKHDSAMETMAQVAEAMQSKRKSIVIFVEGTRSHFAQPGLMPFKKGAFQLALQTGFPIVPIVFSHQAPVYHAKKSHFVGGNLVVKFLSPHYPPNNASELDNFINQVRDVMLNELVKISPNPAKL